MTHRLALLGLLSTTLTAFACAPTAAIDNVQPLEIAAPACTVAGPRTTPWLVDLRTDVEGTVLMVPLTSELVVEHGDGPFAFTADDAAIFYAVEGGALEAFAADADTAETVRALRPAFVSLTQTTANELIILPALTADDIVALREEAVVAAALRTTDDRLRLTLNVQLKGAATSLTSDVTTTLSVSSSFTPLAVDLCDGCLVTSCNGPDDVGGCFEGVDRPSSACRE